MQKFSVLLSLYSKENPKFLKSSLESVFCQSCKPNEVILVEDGPIPDYLEDLVKQFEVKYSELKVIKLENNVGLGAALNEGLKSCSYDIVARMDTDDICKPNRFEKQLSYFENHPEFDVVGAWIDEFIDDPSNVVSTRKLPEYHDDIFIFGKKRNPINHPVVMFRKEAVLSVDSYMPFYLFEDYYLWARMLVSGKKFYNIPESLLWFRFSPDMFKRRGGIKYARTEVAFQWTLYKIGYIGLFSFCKNVGVRFFVRIIPNSLRGMIYKRMIRK